ncbi:MAG: hypothetical protein PHT12_02435 [Patescibacteria group bacterium]|nr:hypothetical protein [Patescibacteria group bacterium]
MDIQDKIIVKLTEIDANVKDLVAWKGTMEVKIDNLNNHVEGFVKLHEALDCEVAALRHKVDRFEGRLA